MSKPINIHNKLPTIKTKELEKIYKKLGFEQLKENNQKKHIKYIHTEKGTEVILMKGNKDIKHTTLKTIINELAIATGKNKDEILELIFKK